jgi:hypothetical protein
MITGCNGWQLIVLTSLFLLPHHMSFLGLEIPAMGNEHGGILMTRNWKVEDFDLKTIVTL